MWFISWPDSENACSQANSDLETRETVAAGKFGITRVTDLGDASDQLFIPRLALLFHDRGHFALGPLLAGI